MIRADGRETGRTIRISRDSVQVQRSGYNSLCVRVSPDHWDGEQMISEERR